MIFAWLSLCHHYAYRKRLDQLSSLDGTYLDGDATSHGWRLRDNRILLTLYILNCAAIAHGRNYPYIQRS
jgi:hypothetical protein